MTDLRITDFKKGDVVAFKPGLVGENGVKVPKLGVVRTINKERETISVEFKARIDGALRTCRWYFKPADIIGFY